MTGHQTGDSRNGQAGCCQCGADPHETPEAEEVEGLAEAVTRIRAEWNRGDDGDWHYLHGPAGDNLKPEKASPAIAQLLTAIRTDLDDLAVIAGGCRKVDPARDANLLVSAGIERLIVRWRANAGEDMDTESKTLRQVCNVLEAVLTYATPFEAAL